MKKIKNLDLIISLSLLCSFLSSMTLGIITAVFYFVGLSYAVFYTIFYFLFYLIFASTIQVLLSRKPKRFHTTYLLFYVVGALVASAVAIFLMNENPFIKTTYYAISGLAATIFWVFDSIILQSKMKSLK